MVHLGFASLLLFTCVTHAICQYYDFFPGLQPFLQTPRPRYDVTQKPRKATTKARLNYATESTRPSAPAFQSSRSTKRTQKPKSPKDKNDQIHFINDGYSVHNNRYTTQNPFANRPGVRPAVTNGPPITNRPPTTASYEGPELILGPDVSYLSATERRRYLDLAEKMCDRHKAAVVKQVQAIPLLPSPRPVSVNVSSCPAKVPLVVGGTVASIAAFPHMGLLGWPRLGAQRGGGYSWKCGGSLLSERFVLTAAHCAFQDKDNSVHTGPPHAVQLGSSYLDDPGALVVKVSAAIRHPSYKLPKSYHDIALIKLAKPVTFSEVVRPACLGTPPSPGDPIIATGWGKTEFGGDQSLELRSVSIPVWDIPQCREALGTSRKIPEGPSRETQICAGEMDGGKDTCQGDSGGPAQIQDGCVWRVVAVTSLGRSCGAPRTPALYAIAQPLFISAVVFADQTDKRTAPRVSDRRGADAVHPRPELNKNKTPSHAEVNQTPRNTYDPLQRSQQHHYRAEGYHNQQEAAHRYRNDDSARNIYDDRNDYGIGDIDDTAHQYERESESESRVW